MLDGGGRLERTNALGFRATGCEMTLIKASAAERDTEGGSTPFAAMTNLKSIGLLVSNARMLPTVK